MDCKKFKIRTAMGVCFVCNEANSVVIDQKVRNENTEDLPHYVITGDICDKCKERFKQGYIALVAIRNSYKLNIRLEEAEFIGKSIFVKKDSQLYIDLGLDKVNSNIVFCDEKLIDDLIGKYNELHENKQDE